MIPVLTPGEMGGVDRAAATAVPGGVATLVERAGAAVARAALGMLGGAYGRRVVVVAGPGNNGADGRVAARRLAARGVAVTVVDAGTLGPGAVLPACDLVVDAAYGTGLRRRYAAPDPGDAAVLAVDIPSGISGVTGEVPDGDGGGGDPVRAAATVTFAALKPGLLLGAGRARSGAVAVADIGLGALVDPAARSWLVTDADVVAALPRRSADSHKYRSAVYAVAGSPGMTGAAWWCSQAAMRAGAGYVALSVPGLDLTTAGLPPSEVVSRPLPAAGWVDDALAVAGRCRAALVGPGLGPTHPVGPDGDVGRFLARTALPAVVDADGLAALGDLDAVARVTAGREAPVVLTPHDGEFARLAGHPPGADRWASVRDAARRSGAVVLAKGSTTLVAHPDGRVLAAAAGSARLATAGSGDVLSGMIAAFLARGLPALEAAAMAAHVHGAAAADGAAEGLLASDLPDLVSAWLSERTGP